jgi:FixJ family two-component response regulator
MNLAHAILTNGKQASEAQRVNQPLRAALTESEKATMRRLQASGWLKKDIAEFIGCSEQAVNRVLGANK